MRYFKIPIDKILKIQLLGKQTFNPPREHITRYTQEYIMYAISEGKLILNIGDKTVTLVPGDICIFDRGTYQAPASSTYCEYYYLHFLQDDIQLIEMSDKEYQNVLNEKRNKILNAKLYSTKCYEDLCVYVAEQTHISDKSTFDYYINIFKNNIITYQSKRAEMLLNVSNTIQNLFIKLEQLSEMKKSKAYFRAESIAQYIQEHFCEELTGEIIEKNFFVNFDYANRIFESVMMCSIIRYRNLMRLNYAKLKLSTTTVDINKIACEAGFENAAYFSRIFKKYEGISPSEYRKKYLWS